MAASFLSLMAQDPSSISNPTIISAYATEPTQSKRAFGRGKHQQMDTQTTEVVAVFYVDKGL